MEFYIKILFVLITQWRCGYPLRNSARYSESLANPTASHNDSRDVIM
jgi:hypothetical protein